MATRLQHQAWVVAVSVVVFFINLGGSRLWDDDETKNATCAREMFQRGDWVVPTFNSELRTDKPPLAYWLMMGAYSVFGVNEFAARLPSALLALGTTLATYHLGRLLFRSRAGLWAALILATSFMFVWVGRAATPDSSLIFCTTAALLVYVWGVSRGEEGGFLSDGKFVASGNLSAAMPRSRIAVVVAYAFLGLAVLAKGPIGVLLPCATIGLFTLAAGLRSRAHMTPPEHATLASLTIYYIRIALRRLNDALSCMPRAIWTMRPILLAATVFAVALPWYLLVSVRTAGAWPQGFFLTHNVERFLQPIGGHGGTVVFQPIALLAGFFPWTFVLLAGIGLLIRRLRSGDLRSSAYVFLASWIFVWLLFFSVCGTKLPNYVLPAYPALAIVGGAWIADRVAMPALRTMRLWLSVQWGALAIIGSLLIVGFAVVLPQRMPEAAGFTWIGLIPLLGAAVGWLWQRREHTAIAFGSLVMTSALLIAAAYTAVIPVVSARQNGAQVAETLRHFDLKPDRIGAYRITDAGLLFYNDIRHDDWNQCAASVQELFASCERPLLITDGEGYQSIRLLLPADAAVLSRQPRLFRGGEIVVVGRARAGELSLTLGSEALQSREITR
jgi:4-amino-4-deoxy-L-arabinose transferase-like glycosyltransferase